MAFAHIFGGTIVKLQTFFIGTFLHALSSRGVKKNCPSIILLFFKGFEIPKMAAEVLFEVEAVGRDLGMVRGCHFSNRKTREKSKLYEDNFLNTEKEQWVKESAFSHFLRVFRKRVFFHEKTRKNSEKLESVKKNCPSVKKFVQVLRKNIFPNTWTNFFTLGQIF